MTTSATWRKERGAATQRIVAVRYKAIWPAATSAGGGASGRDVLNVPLSIEVKAPHRFEPLSWLRQAEGYREEADELPPHVVLRSDRQGEVSMDQWMVLRRFGHDLALIQELMEMRRAAEQSTWSAPMGGPFA